MGNELIHNRYFHSRGGGSFLGRLAFILIFMLLAVDSAYAENQLYFENIPKTFEFSNKRIKCIAQDDTGFMWFGTFDGLYRYDGHETKLFRSDEDDPATLSSPYVTSLLFTSDRILLVGTSTGLNIYDETSGTFSKFTSGYEPSVNNVYIRTLMEDSRRWIWAAGSDLFCIKENRDTVVKVPVREMMPGSGGCEIHSVTEDNDGNLWIGSDRGLFRYIVETEELLPEDIPVASRPEDSLYEKNIFSLLQDPADRNTIWLGTENGIYRYNYRNRQYRIFNTETTSQILNNTVRTINYLSDSTIVFSTDGGFCAIDRNSEKVTCYRHNMIDYNTIPNDIVQSTYKASNGILWLGTELGVSYLNPERRGLSIKKVIETHGDIVGMQRINDMVVGDNGDVWLGTSNGVLKVPYSQSNLVVNPARYEKGLANKLVRDIHLDKAGTLWAGTDSGLYYLDETTGVFIPIETELQPLLVRYAAAIAEDRNGLIWFSAGYELCAVSPHRDRTGRVTGYDYTLYKPEKFGRFFTSNMLRNDSRHNVWSLVANPGLVYYYDEEADEIKPLKNSRDEEIVIHVKRIQCFSISDDRTMFFGTPEGLYKLAAGSDDVEKVNLGKYTNSSILSVIEQESYLWIATTNGILMHNDQQTSLLIGNYDASVMNFVNHSNFTTKDGLVYLGAFGAYYYFDPASVVLRENYETNPVIITKFASNKQDVSVTGEMPMEEVSDLSDHVVLNYKNNSFKIHFSLLDYLYPQGNSYRYMLEGFDKGWNTNTNGNNVASYVNIPPGKYRFKVKGSYNAESWDDRVTGIEIRILPPWWRTWWAILIYTTLLLGLVWFFLRMVKEKLKLNNELKYQKLEREKSEELNQLKLRFFVNISHEFRTPLTLILDPIEQMLDDAGNEEDRKILSVMKANGNRLLRLVNQILDFRKVEHNMMKLELSYGDMVPFVTNIFNYFTDRANLRQIRYTLESDCRHLYTMFDKDKLEKVLYNLISNAFKYIDAGNEISVTLNAKESEGTLYYVISVKDNGQGIDKEEQPFVFDKFYQVRRKTDKDRNVQGTGIGLMLCKEFVELHNGEISLISEPGLGSEFKIRIPVILRPEEDGGFEEAVFDEEDGKEGNTVPDSRYTVLFVEDNEELRDYVQNNLRPDYRIITAQDGLEGWEAAKKHHPDIVISDVMMPNMDGVELCSKIKTELDSHMPVILLTAKTDEESIIKGLKYGADDYIVKPFSMRMLKLRASKLLESREMLQEYYKGLALRSPKNVIIETDDDKFIVDFVALVEENMDNPEFKIEFIVEKMEIQRHHLYQRIKSLTGLPVNEFIRSIRLERAGQLFRDTNLNISEVMYRCGFSGMSYFYKCFEEKYGVKPAEYIKENRKKKSEY